MAASRPASAAAIRKHGDVLRQKRAQLAHIAVAGSREKRGGDFEAAFHGHRKAGARGADVGPRAAGELPARRRLTAERFRDLLEGDAEHVVQQKGGAFQRRQALERELQRQGGVVEFILLRLDQRFWQPRPDVGLAPAPR